MQAVMYLPKHLKVGLVRTFAHDYSHCKTIEEFHALGRVHHMMNVRNALYEQAVNILKASDKHFQEVYNTRTEFLKRFKEYVPSSYWDVDNDSFTLEDLKLQQDYIKQMYEHIRMEIEDKEEQQERARMEIEDEQQDQEEEGEAEYIDGWLVI